MSNPKHSSQEHPAEGGGRRARAGGARSVRRFWSGAAASLERLVLRGQLGPRSGEHRDRWPERML